MYEFKAAGIWDWSVLLSCFLDSKNLSGKLPCYRAAPSEIRSSFSLHVFPSISKKPVFRYVWLMLSVYFNIFLNFFWKGNNFMSSCTLQVRFPSWRRGCQGPTSPIFLWIAFCLLFRHGDRNKRNYSRINPFLWYKTTLFMVQTWFNSLE